MYLKGARRYVLTVADGAFPNGGTEHWRNIAERAHGAAVLAAIPSDWPETLKERCRNESTAFVKEFAAQFKAKADLGNPWKCSWWAGEMGIAAWFVWDRLDSDTQNDVGELGSFLADPLASTSAGPRGQGDTDVGTP